MASEAKLLGIRYSSISQLPKTPEKLPEWNFVKEA